MNLIFVFAALLLTPLIFIGHSAEAKNLLFLDNSVANDTYIPSNKERQISLAFEIAVEDTKVKYPKCDLKASEMIERSSLTNVMNQVADIKKRYKPSDTVIVGLIHSSEALLAAKSFATTDFILVSSGATSENLASENENLFSFANPSSAFVSYIDKFILDKKVKSLAILVPGNSSYAFEFATLTSEAAKKRNLRVKQLVVDTAQIEESLKKDLSEVLKSDAIFVPGFIQQSLPMVAMLQQKKFKGFVIGTPNWGRSMQDLNSLIKQIHISERNLYFPVSWLAGESESSARFERKFRKRAHEEPMGTAVYTYDTTLMASDFLCSSTTLRSNLFREFINSYKSRKVKTARLYRGIEENHVKSKISFINVGALKERDTK